MRINVDSCALRDPRVLRLAAIAGLHRQRILGALLDVWAVCYDRVTTTIPALDVDTASELEGFASMMCDRRVQLGEAVGDDVRVAGVERRIRYLLNQREHGKSGGKASGKSRRSKQSRRVGQGSAKQPSRVSKPSGSGSGSAPDLDLAHTEGEPLRAAADAAPSARKRASSPRTVKTLLPESWAPNLEHAAEAKRCGADMQAEVAKMRDWAASNGARKADWNATFRNWLRRAPTARPQGNASGYQRPAEPTRTTPRAPPPVVNVTREQQDEARDELRRLRAAGWEP